MGSMQPLLLQANSSFQRPLRFSVSQGTFSFGQIFQYSKAEVRKLAYRAFKARIFTQCFKFFKSRRGLLERAFYAVFLKNNIKQYTETFQF